MNSQIGGNLATERMAKNCRLADFLFGHKRKDKVGVVGEGGGRR